jgi:murein L,D-transpeptidase YcbB/YkuD
LRFYRERDFHPAWSGVDRGVLREELMRAIAQIKDHGLDSADYHQDVLHTAMAADDWLAIELYATDAYLMLAAHLLGGRLDPVTIEPNWTAGRRERDLVHYLQRALSDQRIAESLDELKPQAAEYRILMQALAAPIA